MSRWATGVDVFDSKDRVVSLHIGNEEMKQANGNTVVFWYNP